MMSTINVTNITVNDIAAFVDECQKVAQKAQDASEAALAEYTDAVEGLLAIARLTPEDGGSIADFGERGEAVTRLIRATQAFKRASN